MCLVNVLRLIFVRSPSFLALYVLFGKPCLWKQTASKNSLQEITAPSRLCFVWLKKNSTFFSTASAMTARDITFWSEACQGEHATLANLPSGNLRALLQQILFETCFHQIQFNQNGNYTRSNENWNTRSDCQGVFGTVWRKYVHAAVQGASQGTCSLWEEVNLNNIAIFLSFFKNAIFKKNKLQCFRAFPQFGTHGLYVQSITSSVSASRLLSMIRPWPFRKRTF